MIDRLSAALEGRYRIERELGAGGMATVYLARDLRHDRQVAVKVLRPELAAVVGGERFLAEIRTTANLQHPHILPLYDSGEADTFLFYVMPYVEGETLREKLDRERQLPVDEAVRIARAVATGLHYAHRQGVVHRDIKPANILLQDGEPVIADFGIALAVQQAGGGRLTETGLSLGTPYYMSPEQATADRDPDARSDVYSLGCVVYEMLTGDPPFQGSTAQAVLGRILTAQAERPTERRKAIPPHVEAVVLKSLAKLPADRLASAADFAAAISDRDVAAALVEESGERPPAARPGLVPALAALCLILAAAAVVGWLRPAPDGRVSRYTIEMTGGLDLSPSRFYAVDITPDGSAVVFAGQSADLTGLWIRPLDRIEATFISGTEGADNPAVSPDGSRVAFNAFPSGRSALLVADLQGGGAYSVTDSLVDQGGISWGEDGYIYYDGHLEGDGIARTPERGGRPEPVTFPDHDAGELWHNDPQALPGGRGVLFSVARGNIITNRDFQVAVVEEAGGPHRILVDGGHGGRYVRSGHLLFARAGRMMAAPFDLDRLELTGTPTPVFEGIETRSLGRVDAAVSRDGTLVYVAGDTATFLTRLVWLDRQGRQTPVEVDLDLPVFDPAISPDGTRAAVSVLEAQETYHIWVLDLIGGGARKLTFDGSNFDASWTPEGEEILFLSVDESNRRRLMGVPADGRSQARRVVPEVGDQALVLRPSPAPDGNWILYETDENGSAASMNLGAAPTHGGSAPRLLLEGLSRLGAPRVSPDGRWLAYVSNEAGRDEVYVRSYPDVDRSKAQVSSGGGRHPIWSRDGSELFYVNPSEDLVSVPVLPGAGFNTGRQVRLFSRRPLGTLPRSLYDVHPDGDRFLMFTSSGGGESGGRLVVVENFATELGGVER